MCHKPPILSLNLSCSTKHSYDHSDFCSSFLLSLHRGFCEEKKLLLRIEKPGRIHGTRFQTYAYRPTDGRTHPLLEMRRRI